MNMLKLISKSVLVLAIVVASSCDDRLSEINQNPNGIAPASANPNLVMPEVMNNAARSYLELGYGDVAGVVQHIQHDGWFDGVNHYNWGPQDWSGWYNMLRNNEFMYKRSVELNYKFHQGVALTMRSFIFGAITDLWGDAPYMAAVKGDVSNEFLAPAFIQAILLLGKNLPIPCCCATICGSLTKCRQKLKPVSKLSMLRVFTSKRQVKMQP